MKSHAQNFASLTTVLGEAIYRNRRRFATASAMLLACLLGYFAVAGDNGISVFQQKRLEDKQLAKQIEQLKQENSQLQAHVERLKSDPEAIEHEAREKLHYTRAGEVIYTMPESPDANPATTTGSANDHTPVANPKQNP